MAGRNGGWSKPADRKFHILEISDSDSSSDDVELDILPVKAPVPTSGAAWSQPSSSSTAGPSSAAAEPLFTRQPPPPAAAAAAPSSSGMGHQEALSDDMFSNITDSDEGFELITERTVDDSPDPSTARSSHPGEAASSATQAFPASAAADEVGIVGMADSNDFDQPPDDEAGAPDALPPPILTIFEGKGLEEGASAKGILAGKEDDFDYAFDGQQRAEGFHTRVSAPG